MRLDLRPLTALLLVAVTLVPALAAPRPADALDASTVGGWGARAPAWVDPGGRAPVSGAGATPRALPPVPAWTGPALAERSPGVHAGRADAEGRPRLVALGRRQTDGG
ncbi:MAG: hypothetical protein P1P87_16190 [Trueperaceae bacterium]|nr:hypothetical protein [Trueperaceae bacterium]